MTQVCGSWSRAGDEVGEARGENPWHKVRNRRIMGGMGSDYRRGDLPWWRLVGGCFGVGFCPLLGGRSDEGSPSSLACLVLRASAGWGLLAKLSVVRISGCCYCRWRCLPWAYLGSPWSRSLCWARVGCAISSLRWSGSGLYRVFGSTITRGE